MKYHYDKIIIGVLIIFIFVYFFKNNYEYFFDRDDNIIPIPAPRDYPAYVQPNYPINDFMYNNTLLPYTVPYLNTVQSQQQQLRQGNPWLYSNKLQEPTFFPNYTLPAPVIGSGYRRIPTLGGTENSMPNLMSPLNISNKNVAPVNLAISSFTQTPQQLGTIQHIFSKDNEIYPLYGVRLNDTGNKFKYYSRMGSYGLITELYKIKCHSKMYIMDELGTNDEVFANNDPVPFRCTIYEESIPQYVNAM